MSTVWMGRTLNMIGKTLNLIKCCSFFQKCDNKDTELFFFLYCVNFTIFLEVSPQEVYRNYLGTKNTFKAAQKPKPSQFCSKNSLNEAIFPKNGNCQTVKISFF